jgi:hypothetical protein
VIADDGTVYGRLFNFPSGWITVRWHPSGGGWSAPEAVPGVPAGATILAVSRSGRLAGYTEAQFSPEFWSQPGSRRAFVWDPVLGAQAAVDPGRGLSYAWGVQDGPGRSFTIAGQVSLNVVVWTVR